MGMTGNELATLRRRAGLSQAVLAKRAGVSRQTISYWENKPALDGRVTTLAGIARAFDPPDRQRILNSRPGLGFVRLQVVGSISLANLRVFHAATALRSAVHAQMHRQDCGALTRRGMSCKLKSEPGKARCRLHGGLSTGPKTEEGKARIAEAQRRRWAKYRQQLGKPDKT
ncbi:HGGxSTG domain-containing protein [Paracoccus laeviglucosivorans]|uniref:Helix-turn-helix domain-containing protein n=1 Tax=Paracoccus laeviglucosivorans TaxID=1197861 RepID=A0A521DDT3_9RHOB|nr:HGGxSTG domain-containing protein [Paracoccus laeviglucosivorans]SMO69748.1 Helix-turn-helix domain-containing protein [Paracoccus laeviglucosivorans]